MPFLFGLFLKIGIPERLHKLVAIVLALVVALLAIWGVVTWIRHDAIRKHDAAINSQAEVIRTEAAAAASSAAADVKTKVEAQNAQASKAAQDSDDPLAAGLHSLHAASGRHPPAH